MVNINKYAISNFHLISLFQCIFPFSYVYVYWLKHLIVIRLLSSKGICFSRTCQKKRLKPVNQPTQLQKTSWIFFQEFIKHCTKLKWLFSFEFAFSGKVDFCNSVFWMIPELFFPLGHWVMDGWENPFALK